MPLYEFTCACGAIAELFRKIAARDELLVCDLCGATMTRIVSLPQPGNTEGDAQTGLMVGGRVIPGQFGKEARLGRPKHAVKAARRKHKGIPFAPPEKYKP